MTINWSITRASCGTDTTVNYFSCDAPQVVKGSVKSIQILHRPLVPLPVLVEYGKPGSGKTLVSILVDLGTWSKSRLLT